MCSNFILTGRAWLFIALLLFGTVIKAEANRSSTGSDTSVKKTTLVHFFYHHQVRSNIQPKHWNDFVDSYNKKTNPNSELTPFQNAFSFDAGIRVGKSGGFIVMYQHLHRSCEASFAFNEKRRFDIFNNAIAFGGSLPLIKPANSRFFVSLDALMRVGGDVFLTSSYQYRDGFVSYGSDKDLNGTYGGQVTLGWEFGASASIKLLKHLAIESSFRYQINNNVASSTYIDLSSYKALNSGGLQVIELPRDYYAYDPLNLGYYEGIKAAFNGYKLSIGLSYGF